MAGNKLFGLLRKLTDFYCLCFCLAVDLICDESAEAAGNPAALPANQASAGPAPPAGPNRPAAGTSAPLRSTFLY